MEGQAPWGPLGLFKGPLFSLTTWTRVPALGSVQILDFTQVNLERRLHDNDDDGDDDQELVLNEKTVLTCDKQINDSQF